MRSDITCLKLQEEGKKCKHFTRRFDLVFVKFTYVSTLLVTGTGTVMVLSIHVHEERLPRDRESSDVNGLVI